MSSQLCEVLSFSGSSHLAGVSGAVLGSHGCPCPVHGGLLSSWHLHTLDAPRWSEEGWQGFAGRPLVGCVCFLKDVLGHGVGEEEHRCQGPFHHVHTLTWLTAAGFNPIAWRGLCQVPRRSLPAPSCASLALREEGAPQCTGPVHWAWARPLRLLHDRLLWFSLEMIPPHSHQKRQWVD